MHKAWIKGTLIGGALIFAAPAMAVSLDNFRVNGFFDMEYEKGVDSSGGDQDGSFDQVHFNTLLEYQVTDRAVVKHHFEYEHAPQSKDDGKGGEHGKLATEWSYLEYLVNNSLKLRAGYVLTPFGLYNENHDATVTYNSIRTPWGIYKSRSTGGNGKGMFPKFSTGVFATGDIFLENDMTLNYMAYLANGETQDAKNPAEKNRGDLAYGGQVKLSTMTGITVGASYYDGDMDSTTLPSITRNTWLVSAEYNPFPLYVRAEYAQAEVGPLTEVGYYIEGSYTVGKWTPYVRYGSHDPNDAASTDEWTEIVPGVSYQVEPGVVLKAEYRSFGGNTGNVDVGQDYDEVAFAVTVAI